MNNTKYDGIHLRGPGAVRHFTYRAVQSIKPVLESCNPNAPLRRTKTKFSRPIRMQEFPARNRKMGNDDHTDCEQAQYAKQKLQQDLSYAQAVKGRNVYSVPTSNIYELLN